MKRLSMAVRILCEMDVERNNGCRLAFNTPSVQTVAVIAWGICTLSVVSIRSTTQEAKLVHIIIDIACCPRILFSHSRLVSPAPPPPPLRRRSPHSDTLVVGQLQERVVRMEIHKADEDALKEPLEEFTTRLRSIVQAVNAKQKVRICLIFLCSLID